MADELPADIAAVVAEQRATDPRLEQTQTPDPAPAPAPEPDASVEAPAAEGDVPEGAAAPEPDPAKKPKRSAEEVLKGRVGQLTKAAASERAGREDAESRLRAAEALLAARGPQPQPDPQTPPGSAPAAPAAASDLNPQTGRIYTQAEFDQAIAAKVAKDAETASASAFNREADDLYNTGAAKFPDWKENVELLGATGVMTIGFLEATMAAAPGSKETGAALVHHLGADVAEAQRIASLPPIRRAVELTRIATGLTSRSAPISSAPAPIRTVGGAVAPTIDLERAAGGGNDMRAYVEARKKQGSVWAEGRRRG